MTVVEVNTEFLKDIPRHLSKLRVEFFAGDYNKSSEVLVANYWPETYTGGLKMRNLCKIQNAKAAKKISGDGTTANHPFPPFVVDAPARNFSLIRFQERWNDPKTRMNVVYLMGVSSSAKVRWKLGGVELHSLPRRRKELGVLKTLTCHDHRIVGILSLPRVDHEVKVFATIYDGHETFSIGRTVRIYRNGEEPIMKPSTFGCDERPIEYLGVPLPYREKSYHYLPKELM